MIVSITVSNNREGEIGDAIRSVERHVDLVLVLDTGISDRTLDRAREVAGEKLRVRSHIWVDFSTARNASLEWAREIGAEWIVVLDSDERIDFGKVSLREALSQVKSDVVLIESADGFYPKEKIIRAAAPTHYFGPTHEALCGGSRESLRGVVFAELDKTPEQLTKKFERDVILLSEFLKSHPEDGRWWYYLGQSYEGLQEREKAADAFGRCVEIRQFGDEGAWAAFKQAEQLFILERFEEAIRAGARGLGANASFPECAWIAAVASSRLGRDDQAIAWARIAEAVGLFRGHGQERNWFRYLPAHYELPYDVLRWALPSDPARDQAELDFHAARQARICGAKFGLEEASVSRSLAEFRRREARAALRPSPISSVCPGARAVQIQFEPPRGWLPMNPSICLYQDKLWAVVRTVNYTMSGRSYAVHDPHGVIRTENYLGQLNLDGSFENPILMRDLDPTPRALSRIVGYEDLRLVSVQENGKSILTGSATVCDRDPDGRRLIAKLYFDETGVVRSAQVAHSNQDHEKNWMPLSVNGEFTWIYSIDPTAIIPGPLNDCRFALDHLRGGAAIAFEDSYLCVTHEVIEENSGRLYLHRFVRLNGQFEVVAVSKTWTFAHHGIEFCAGMAQLEGELILSYGFEDREAWLLRVPVEEVKKMEWIT